MGLQQAGQGLPGLAGTGTATAHHRQRLAVALRIVEAVLLPLGQVGVLALQLGVESALSTRRRSRAHSKSPLAPRLSWPIGRRSTLPGSSGLLPRSSGSPRLGSAGSTRSLRSPVGVLVVSSTVSFFICWARDLASLMRVMLTGWVRRNSGTL